jgi:hypothetical protein
MRQQWSGPRTRGMRCQLLAMLALSFLQGCQPSEPGSHSPPYLTRLAGFLAVTPPAAAFAVMSPPPPAEALQLPIPASNLDGLDFLSLSGCAVQVTILKRDSSLGRAAKPSQRLLLALEFLQLAPACIQQLQEQGNAQLASSLHAAWQEHQAQLPALAFNATLGSDEFRAFWLTEPASAEYPRSEPHTAAAAARSIDNSVRRWLSGDYRAENLDFELWLSAVAGGDGGAQLHALSRGRNARALHHYRAELAPIIALERRLAAVLPLLYRKWQRQRNHYYAMAAGTGDQHGLSAAVAVQDGGSCTASQRLENWLHCTTHANPAPHR